MALGCEFALAWRPVPDAVFPGKADEGVGGTPVTPPPEHAARDWTNTMAARARPTIRKCTEHSLTRLGRYTRRPVMSFTLVGAMHPEPTRPGRFGGHLRSPCIGGAEMTSWTALPRPTTTHAIADAGRRRPINARAVWRRCGAVGTIGTRPAAPRRLRSRFCAGYSERKAGGRASPRRSFLRVAFRQPPARGSPTPRGRSAWRPREPGRARTGLMVLSAIATGTDEDVGIGPSATRTFTHPHRSLVP
jgi:hypothetical protein